MSSYASWMAKVKYLMFCMGNKCQRPGDPFDVDIHKVEDLTWLIIHRHMVMMQQLHQLLDGEPSTVAIFLTPQLFSLTELQSWIMIRPRQGC